MKEDDRMAALLQAYIQCLANTDRVGCPTFRRLEAFLRGRLKRDVAEEFSDHLTHCRECLLELKTLHDIVQAETGTVGRGRRSLPSKPRCGRTSVSMGIGHRSGYL